MYTLEMGANILKLAGSIDTAASFQFEGEDHTLGNALRYIIMKKCVKILQEIGYTVLTRVVALMLNSVVTPFLILQKLR